MNINITGSLKELSALEVPEQVSITFTLPSGITYTPKASIALVALESLVGELQQQVVEINTAKLERTGSTETLPSMLSLLTK